MAIKGGAGAVAWHSPMGLTSGAYWMLIVNAAWDICCGASMQLEIVLGRRLWLADAHFGLWLYEDDRFNVGFKIMLTMMVLQFGMMRLLSAVGGDPTMAVISYATEALLLALGGVTGHTDPRRGACVCMLCVVCGLALVGHHK